jgi:hypothetical protein
LTDLEAADKAAAIASGPLDMPEIERLTLAVCSMLLLLGVKFFAPSLMGASFLSCSRLFEAAVSLYSFWEFVSPLD